MIGLTYTHEEDRPEGLPVHHMWTARFTAGDLLHGNVHIHWDEPDELEPHPTFDVSWSGAYRSGRLGVPIFEAFEEHGLDIAEHDDQAFPCLEAAMSFVDVVLAKLEAQPGWVVPERRPTKRWYET